MIITPTRNHFASTVDEGVTESFDVTPALRRPKTSHPRLTSDGDDVSSTVSSREDMFELPHTATPPPVE